MDALFALNANILQGPSTDYRPWESLMQRHPSTAWDDYVWLPVRGQLTEENGKHALKLLKTGNTGAEGELSPMVRVLNAVRDAATGLDVITVPGVDGSPGRTILINPVVPPGVTGWSHTGNPSPEAVTPTNTVTEVSTPESIDVLVTPVPDEQELRDFVYWQPDAEGTGFTPVYVVLSGIYGETNTKGKYSGRDYNTDKAGGPVQELDWKTATIDREGVDRVKLHTGRFESTPENVVMIDRLEKILKGDIQATDTDKRYYTHEIRELERYRALGIADGTVPENNDEVWNNTHTATLEDYKLSSDETLLYMPEALYSQE
ncbi:pyocin [Salmonella enterica subsp. salamae]|nr:pyocin [Salmonella enterica subsp. salamae]